MRDTVIESIKDTAKAATVAIGSTIAIKLPDWVESINHLLNGITGFYQFLVFVATMGYLLVKIFYNLKKLENERNKNK